MREGAAPHEGPWQRAQGRPLVMLSSLRAVESEVYACGHCGGACVCESGVICVCVFIVACTVLYGSLVSCRRIR